MEEVVSSNLTRSTNPKADGLYANSGGNPDPKNS